jgi:hypothetical protein
VYPSLEEVCDKKGCMFPPKEEVCDDKICIPSWIEESDFILSSWSDGEEPWEDIFGIYSIKEGKYYLSIEYVNSMGEAIYDYHFIDIYEDPSRLSEISSKINLENRTSEQYSEGNAVVQILNMIKRRGFTEGTAGILSLMALSFPLAFTFFIGFNLNSPISRGKIQQTFYVQCMYASPVFLTVLIMVLSFQYIIPGGAMGFGGFDLPGYFFLGSIILWFVFVIWHLRVEINYISEKLFSGEPDKVKKRKAAFMVFSILIVYYILLFGFMIFSDIGNDIPFYISILFCLVIVVGVPLFKRYSKKQQVQKNDNLLE